MKHPLPEKRTPEIRSNPKEPNQAIRVHLIIPPHGDLTQPPIGVPALVAHLKAKTDVEVTQSDESILAFEYFTQTNRLRRSLENAMKVLQDLEHKPKLGFFEQQHYLAAGKARLVGDYVVQNIEQAKSVLRDSKQFYDPEKYDWSVSMLQRCFGIVSAEFFRTRLSLDNLHMRFNHRSSTDIWDATVAKAENPFIEFFESVTMPHIQSKNPDVIGISITHGAQLIPAFTLARMVKRVVSECKIVFGGAYLPHIAHGLTRNRSFFRWVDAYVIHEGEQALEQLIRLRFKTEKLAGVNNLIFWNPQTREIFRTPRGSFHDLDTSITPDFDDLPLALYLSPEPVFPLVVSRNCYWNRCAFCSRKGQYQNKNESKVVEEIKQLQNRYGTCHFYFAGDVLSPAGLQKLSQAIEKAEIDAYWSTDLRAEKSVTNQLIQQMQRGGCREVRMGLESASSRVLALIDKGIEISTIPIILMECRKQGLGTRISFFVGFPSETESELQETIDFVKQWQTYIDDLDFTYFALERGSIIHESPKQFGITHVYEDPYLDLAFLLRYDVDPGPSMMEVLNRYTRCQNEIDGLGRTKTPMFISKAHNLLYAAKGVTGVAKKMTKQENVFKHVGAPSVLNQRLALSDDVILMKLGYDLDSLSDSVYMLDSQLNEGLLMHGLTPKQIAMQLNESGPPVLPKECFFIYKGLDNRIHKLNNNLAHLLKQCDGQQTGDDICDLVSQKIPRKMVLKTLDSFIAANLVQAVNHPEIH